MTPATAQRLTEARDKAREVAGLLNLAFDGCFEPELIAANAYVVMEHARVAHDLAEALARLVPETAVK